MNEFMTKQKMDMQKKKRHASKQVLEKLVCVSVYVCLWCLLLAVIVTSCVGYSPSGKGGFCDPVELPLLRRLLSLLTDKLDLNFLCILSDTGVDGCFLGCSVVVAVATDLVPGPLNPPTMAPAPMLAPQEHVRVAPAPAMPGWIPLPLLSAGVPALLWRKPF